MAAARITAAFARFYMMVRNVRSIIPKALKRTVCFRPSFGRRFRLNSPSLTKFDRQHFPAVTKLVEVI